MLRAYNCFIYLQKNDFLLRNYKSQFNIKYSIILNFDFVEKTNA